jgi:hypothetical protein
MLQAGEAGKQTLAFCLDLLISILNGTCFT